jgi:hypothetical protein
MDDQGTNRASGGMKYRKLRIAWSVVWGLAALLLVVLWVRSFQRVETMTYTNSAKWFTGVRSDDGEFVVYHGHVHPPRETPGWSYNRFDDSLHQYRGVVWPWTNRSDTAILPYWFLVSLSVIFAVGPWIRQHRWRFSLRTMLIATTLVAVVLGLIVYVANL